MAPVLSFGKLRPWRGACRYMIKCSSYPYRTGARSWRRAVANGGVRLNPSPKSHAALNEPTTLEAGEPVELADPLNAIRRCLPHFCLFAAAVTRTRSTPTD